MSQIIPKNKLRFKLQMIFDYVFNGINCVKLCISKVRIIGTPGFSDVSGPGKRGILVTIICTLKRARADKTYEEIRRAVCKAAIGDFIQLIIQSNQSF